MRAFSIKCSDIAQCPDLSLSVRHYREDGSCLHHPPRTVADGRHDEREAHVKTIDERLANLAYAVRTGGSNPPLILRANRIADDIGSEHPELAARLRTALTKRWESLGNRYERLQQIRRDLAAANDEPRPDSPAGPDQVEGATDGS